MFMLFFYKKVGRLGCTSIGVGVGVFDRVNFVVLSCLLYTYDDTIR